MPSNGGHHAHTGAASLGVEHRVSPPRAMLLALSSLLFVASDCPLCGFAMKEKGKSGWLTWGVGETGQRFRLLAPWLSVKQETAGPGGSMKPGDQSK